MIRIGAPLESGEPVSATGDINGISGHVSSIRSGALKNPATINSTVEVTSDENLVLAGPITISSTGSLVCNGVVTIV
jgi:hypothetical protein